MSTYKEMLQAARDYLKEHEIADADVDAWYLLAYVFKINRAEFFMTQLEEVSHKDYHRYMEYIKERASHIPLQHITGVQEFMGLEFHVNEHVLIPRQDTEILVEEVLKVSEGKEILDMCTGSGCVIISLGKLGGPKRVVGVDISTKALEIASKNAQKHNVNVEWINSDLFHSVGGEYDIIVSNPPYIPTGELSALMPEVKNHEPCLALDGHEDGLAFYRRIVKELKYHLKQGGLIFFEIGHNQGKAVEEILQNADFSDIQIKKDLCGHDRVVYGKRS